MILTRNRDWKQFLSLEDETKLNDILNKVMRYRGAYKNAEDVKNAQLWCAVLHLRKENAALLDKMKKIEGVFDAMQERMFKHDNEKKELLKSLENF